MRLVTSAFVTACLVALSLALGACGKPQLVPRAAPGVTVASITVTSPSFPEGGRLPVDNTCDGKDLSPELVLSSPPDGTKSLLFIVEDPDAPNGTFTHLILFNVSPDVRKLPAGVTETTGLGDGARFGLNDFQAAHYSGPCPPRGESHRYRFRVTALDVALKLQEGATRSQIDEAVDGHIIGDGVLTGYFGH
jgi:Raf kinase inhibitor-like YbhB/YbcL family protein